MGSSQSTQRKVPQRALSQVDKEVANIIWGELKKKSGPFISISVTSPITRTTKTFSVPKSVLCKSPYLNKQFEKHRFKMLNKLAVYDISHPTFEVMMMFLLHDKVDNGLIKLLNKTWHEDYTACISMIATMGKYEVGGAAMACHDALKAALTGKYQGLLNKQGDSMRIEDSDVKIVMSACGEGSPITKLLISAILSGTDIDWRRGLEKSLSGYATLVLEILREGKAEVSHTCAFPKEDGKHYRQTNNLYGQ
ncbi:hypothetical protein BJ878DRAFT_567000 [Calycina marina]|uniref:Uncharacterized protein n=1 Tax=Calycina marina TaxID=1763456 RepID=A0A9P7Z4B8_9HELO|nr:hypothetical protein BJ878DRAFT_567000 [Calycina marina]